MWLADVRSACGAPVGKRGSDEIRGFPGGSMPRGPFPVPVRLLLTACRASAVDGEGAAFGERIPLVGFTPASLPCDGHCQGEAGRGWYLKGQWPGDQKRSDPTLVLLPSVESCQVSARRGHGIEP